MHFSEIGEKEAASCSFPAELLSDGRCFWSAKYCCENLLKMTDLDTTGSAIVRSMEMKRRLSVEEQDDSVEQEEDQE